MNKKEVQHIELEVASLQPRAINPNEMSSRDFDAYMREVERLGRPPKPIVVRPLGDGRYEIVDGEHAWRCACELDLPTVLCECREIDDFEASRECFNRNRGGTDNPVILGRLFTQMMEQRKLSQRKLAKELNISEGQVRNKREYLKAATLRTEYAPTSAESDVAELTNEQMRFYINLPGTVRDFWLDAGSDTAVFDVSQEWTRDRVAYEIHRSGLSAYLDGTSKRFGDSVFRLARLALWLEQHGHVSGIREYVAAVAELSITPDVMEFLPIDHHNDQVFISAQAWKKLLHKAAQKQPKRQALIAATESGVRLALEDEGVDPEDICTPEEAEALRVVARAPAFIKSADHLRLPEKQWLAQVEVDVDEEVLREVQRRTCDLLLDARCGTGNSEPKCSGPIESVVDSCLRELAVDQLFQPTEELVELVTRQLSTTASIQSGVVNGVPAREALRSRLNELDWPEFFLIASYVMDSPPHEAATARWLHAMEANFSQEGDDAA